MACSRPSQRRYSQLGAKVGHTATPWGSPARGSRYTANRASLLYRATRGLEWSQSASRVRSAVTRRSGWSNIAW